MGMICFLRDMTLGRKTALSLGSTSKARRMVSSLPRYSSWVPSSSTSVSMRITMSYSRSVRSFSISVRNSSLRSSIFSESMQVIWPTPSTCSAMWNSLKSLIRSSPAGLVSTAPEKS